MCLLVVATIAGCASAPPAAPAPPPPPAPPPTERPYLVAPTEGWAGELTPAQADLLADGHAAVEGADPAAVRDAVAALVGNRAPGTYPPAAVLAAEADLLEGRPLAAVSLLEPLAEEQSRYTALQLVLGRAAEATGDLVGAFAAFRRAAGDSVLAFDRREELRPRVEEVLANRVADALRRGETPTAGRALARLREWLPEAETTWRAALAVAEARGDRPAQLEAARQLAARFPEDRSLQERQAELELEAGDAKAGLDLYEGLVERYPADPALVERLAYAKFRWRVGQMPPKVASAAARAELERGDMAVLLYWLVPRVRSARGGEARIASDILDDPRREEIARVLNLGLMDRDPSVHRFYPSRPVRRATVLLAVLRVLDRMGGAACAAPISPNAGEAAGTPAVPGAETLCALALDCGLHRPEEGCRLEGTPSGAEVVDLLRRALARMASDGDGPGGA